jgi:hypothetical protein
MICLEKGKININDEKIIMSKCKEVNVFTIVSLQEQWSNDFQFDFQLDLLFSTLIYPEVCAMWTIFIEMFCFKKIG